MHSHFWTCIESMAGCWFLGIQRENKGPQKSMGFINETDYKVINSRTVRAEEGSGGRFHRGWYIFHLAIHKTFLYGSSISQSPQDMSMKDGQSPCSLGLTLQWGSRKGNNWCVCVFILWSQWWKNPEKTKQKREWKGEKKRDQNCRFNNDDQPIPCKQNFDQKPG